MPTATVLPPELLAVPRNRWDAAIETLLAVLLAFMPLAFGAVDAWSELVVMALAAALAGVVLLRAVFDRSFMLPWTWAYVPLAAFVALIALQIVPLPESLVSMLSPGAASTRVELLGEADSAASATLSLYPSATAHELRLVLVGVAVFFAAASAFRTSAQIKRVLLIVFTIGCVEAGLSLAQIVTKADRMYWAFDAGREHLTSGSFVNYSNFSQFMNLSIGAGLALLLIRLLAQPSFGARDDAARAFGGAQLSDYAGILAAIVLAAVAVLASLSRNGVLSMMIAGLVVGAALFFHGGLSRRGWILAALPMGALAAVLIFGFDTLYDRLATLQDRSQTAGRWELTRDTLRAWQTFPIFGAGLGTHEYVFPMFDQSNLNVLSQQADNDYAQLLEETGVAGGVCVAAFLAVIAALLVRLCARGKTAISAAAFGLAFGFIAVGIHSATDFGQHLPAVFCLSAVACGLVVQLARLERPDAASAAVLSSSTPRRIVAAILLVVIALSSTWILSEAYAAQRGEQWWAAASQLDDEIQKAGSAASDADYASLLVAAEQAVDFQPQNVNYGYWLNLWRWRAMSRNVDPKTGQTLLPPSAHPLVARIADELAKVRAVCPFYGPPYGLEGQLRLSVLNDKTGAPLIKQGVRLAPYDGPTCLIAGELAAHEGDADEAQRLLKRAVSLAPEFFTEAAAVMLNDLDRPDWARDLAGDDYGRLEVLAGIAAASPKHADLEASFRQEAEIALRRRAENGMASAAEYARLASLEVERGNTTVASNYYRNALDIDYNQFEWRLARADLLMKLGDDAQALREVRIVLHNRPNDERARKLFGELSLRANK